jgi:hypothetical protein
MRKSTRVSSRGRLGILLAGVVTALVIVSPASAVELNGGWAPFNRCPVDHPLVSGTDGISGAGSGSICVAASSPSGTIKLGKMDVQATRATNVQAGGRINSDNNIPLVGGRPGGAVISQPVKVKGGLLGLACGTGNDPLNLRRICRDLLEDNILNRVDARVKSAGRPTDFNLIAGLVTDVPIMKLPVKIQLQNPLLGNKCFIGGEANPIVLQPANTVAPTNGAFNTWALNGDPDTSPTAPLASIVTTGATQADSTFSVPKAHGCGLLNLFDGAINSKVGLPSPSGQNEVVLNDATSAVMVPNLSDGSVPGTVFAQGWHSAVLP